MNRISERDWKALRAMNDELLNLACERIFEKVEAILGGRGNKPHEAYLGLWKLLKKEDYQIALMFDELKRSNALQKLAAWRRNGLLTDERLERFSEETRDSVRLLS